MLRLASSLVASALFLSAMPALADDAKADGAKADGAKVDDAKAGDAKAGDAKADAPPAAPPVALPPSAMVRYPLPPPPYPYWHRTATERRSTGAMVSGIILAVIGSFALGIGTGMYLGESSNCDEIPRVPRFPGDQPDFRCFDNSGKVAAMTVLLVGAGVVAGGVGLWVYGGQHVPKSEKAETASALPAVRLGPSSAALRWSF